MDIPFRIQRIDIVEFINYLAAQKASSETRKRKLAKDVLGHKKMETTYNYVHLDRTNLRREMEAGRYETYVSKLRKR